MRKFLQEFKEFALRGNVMDLAVGVIIGAAFQAIVTSLTQDIISPVLGLFTGQNFDQLSVNLFGATLHYGAFITAIVNFIIMAFIIFLLVKGMNHTDRSSLTASRAGGADRHAFDWRGFCRARQYV